MSPTIRRRRQIFWCIGFAQFIIGSGIGIYGLIAGPMILIFLGGGLIYAGVAENEFLKRKFAPIRDEEL